MDCTTPKYKLVTSANYRAEKCLFYTQATVLCSSFRTAGLRLSWKVSLLGILRSNALVKYKDGEISFEKVTAVT